jgi:hypothetical protein
MATEIRINTYQKKDGSLMIYINNDRRVSIGISADRGFSPYGNGSTQGQRNLWDAFWSLVQTAEQFTGDLSTHDEPGFCAVRQLAEGIALAGTDVCNIGGHKVGSDGSYVVVRGRILHCGTSYEVD